MIFHLLFKKNSANSVSGSLAVAVYEPCDRNSVLLPRTTRLVPLKWLLRSNAPWQKLHYMTRQSSP